MRSEKTQFQQLLVQNTCNIWRKNAFATLLSSSKKEYGVGFGGEEEVNKRRGGMRRKAGREGAPKRERNSELTLIYRETRERKSDKRGKKEKKRFVFVFVYVCVKYLIFFFRQEGERSGRRGWE